MARYRPLTMAGLFRWLPRRLPCSMASRPCPAFAPARLPRSFLSQSATRQRRGPEAQQERAHMTKGKLLTTPNRLLKFILPLPTGPVGKKDDKDGKDRKDRKDRKDSNSNSHIEPLSLVLHPQQPISYVQRLIQAELPPLVGAQGHKRPPKVTFWAEDTGREDTRQHATPGSHVATYSGLGHEAKERSDSDKDWVRWGSSTEMGDFIREAARGREFVIRIEDGEDQDQDQDQDHAGRAAKEVRISVPSFDDRTYYQRMRLRRLSRQIEHLADIKHDCDLLAHRSARNLAKGGFGILMGWWGAVFYVSFCTDYGWDLVEPITYLASLTAILGGYFWFLFISRDVSYKSAMHVTVSRHQTSLYETRGFNVRRWEQLTEEANGLRAEIRRVAYEYDVDWDEARDLGSEKIKKVLEKEEKRTKNSKEAEQEEDGEAEDEEAAAAEEEEEEHKSDDGKKEK